ncbi:MAG: uroporphyrinogen-III synthase [Halobacteriales archaeon]|nr:uroporphyrinogen-III synthase [Halobacteriales archaeon]
MSAEKTTPRVAFFRPADERAERAVESVREHGFEPLSDPLLKTVPTGATPRTDADYVVLTSVTGVEIAADTVRGTDAVVCAVGPKTADALRDEGVEVSVVPDEYTSAGIVRALAERVEGARVEVARSDHGSDELLDGLNQAGAYVHETVLYKIVLPEGGGEATARALDDGTLDAALFTSSLTVEHLVEVLEETGVGVDALEDVLVGVIGEPTRRTAESAGVDVDVVAEEETFESLVGAVAERL